MMTFKLLTLALLLLMAAGGCSSDPPSGCTTDQDCEPGFFCRAGKCDFDCRNDGECPVGYTCTPRGKCEQGCSKTNGGIEACDGVDNNCDGSTDENFTLLGEPCSNQGCEGIWVCAADGSDEVCNGPFPAEDDHICDGQDEDCDGETDEDAVPIPCPLQEGVCAGAQDVCLDTGQWSGCDYGPEYTEGIDEVCDQVDSDCDGLTDEDAVPLLVAESGAQAGDQLDNNCNGLVDEPGGVMVPLPHYPTQWIDAYETAVFENPDCTGQQYGVAADDYPAGWPAEDPATVELYACSVAGVVPSGHLSWFRARRACQAQGKRLCTVLQWGDGCTGGTAMFYPYGPNFVPNLCNDPLGGTGQVVETGSYEDCVSRAQVYDASGNLMEWVQDLDAARPGNAHVGGFHYLCELCSGGVNCYPCNPAEPVHVEMIEKNCDCAIGLTNDRDTYPMTEARAYMGARCCLEIP